MLTALDIDLEGVCFVILRERANAVGREEFFFIEKLAQNGAETLL